MLDRKNIKKVFAGVLTLISLIQPAPAYAWWEDGDRHDHFEHGEHRRYEHHEHPHCGLRVSFLPHGFFTISLGGSRYYYCDGVYYNRIDRDYVVVAPPIGASVRTIPEDYEPVVIIDLISIKENVKSPASVGNAGWRFNIGMEKVNNGATYYTSDGVYYLYTRRGYQIVSQPVTVLASGVSSVPTTVPIQVTATAASANTEESFTVNIPNFKGGYTAVILKRSGNGFIGPQGEFYSEFPKVEQLKAMYGK